MTYDEQCIDSVRLRDVAIYLQIPDVLMLGMLYENRTMIEEFCSGIKIKKEF